MNRMTVYTFNNSKDFLRAKLRTLPRRGRGQIEKLAKFLNVHQSLISQILHTSRNFSEDQAYLVCQFLSLDENETEYFVTLVQIERSASEGLKKILQQRLNILRLSASSREEQKQIKSLDEVDKETFYSH